MTRQLTNPKCETGSKVWVLLQKNGDKTSVVDVFNSGGMAEMKAQEANAAVGGGILHFVVGKRVVGPDIPVPSAS